MAVSILHDDPTLRVGSAANLLLAAWWDAPTAEQMRTFGGLARVFQRECGRPTGFWDTVVGGTPRFSGEVRQEATALTADPELFPLGTAHVILLGGFRGAATRAFLTTVTLVGRPPNPTHVFGDLESGSRWLAARMGEAWPAEAILAAHAQLVARP